MVKEKEAGKYVVEDGEIITLPTRAECEANGTVDGEAAPGVPLELKHPSVVDIVRSGYQALRMVTRRDIRGISRAESAYRGTLAEQQRSITEAQREHAELTTLRQDRDEQVARVEQAVDVAAADGSAALSAWRFPFLRDIPGWLHFAVLATLAVGEFILNRLAFEATREPSINVDMLAATLGVALVAACYVAGISIRRVLDNPKAAEGRNPAHIALIGTLPALAVGLLSVASIRAAYFNARHVPVPLTAMLGIQIFLALTAVAVSIAHTNHVVDEDHRRQDVIENHERRLEKAEKRERATRRARLSAEEELRTHYQETLDDVETQVEHTSRLLCAYAGAYARASKVTVTLDELPKIELSTKLRQISAWLEAHPALADDEEGESTEEDSGASRPPSLFDVDRESGEAA